jgi:putative glycosyltransferase (TIGR04372 family)
MRPYHLLNRLIASISLRTGFFIVTPYARNIGNCAEEMYYTLLKARRDHTRALFLFPQPVGWKVRIDVANRALEAVESPFGWCPRGVLARMAGRLLTLIFFVLGQIYLQTKRALRQAPLSLTRRWAESRNNIFYVIPSLGRANLWQPHGVERFSMRAAEECQWSDQYSEPVPVRLAQDERERAHDRRIAMGLPSERWFVCLHVREGGFHQDWRFGTSRNCDIRNYIPAITAVTDAGGVVVRIGDPTMTRLPSMEGVIDYAHSRFKSELMDLYFISECRFYLGVNSGPLDVAWLFGKPVVLTNVTEWAVTFARAAGDRIILKHVYSRSLGRFLSLSEIVLAPFEAQAFRELGSDYVLVENTPDEIRDVVLEHLASPGGRALTPKQAAFNEARKTQMRAWLTQSGLRFLDDERDDAVERYRLAAHAGHSGGAVGRSYIERFWDRDNSDSRAVAGAILIAQAV